VVTPPTLLVDAKLEENGGRKMSKERVARVLPLLVSMLFLATCLSAAASPSEPKAKFKCGLNTAATDGPEAYVARHLVGIYPSDDIDLINIVNATTEADKALGRPQAFQYSPGPTSILVTEGGENAVTIGENKPYGLPPKPWTMIVMDEAWVESLAEKAGTSWARTAILAHELGHIYHGDVWTNFNGRLEPEERKADFFAGESLARLGASLSNTVAVFGLLDHPKERVAAAQEGWLDEVTRYKYHDASQQPEWEGPDVSIHFAGGPGFETGFEAEIGGIKYSASEHDPIRLPLGENKTIRVHAPAISSKWLTIERATPGKTYMIGGDPETGVVLLTKAPPLQPDPEYWKELREKLGL
jgi:hypothetical protein